MIDQKSVVAPINRESGVSGAVEVCVCVMVCVIVCVPWVS
jgi:hypothetical protein